MKIVTRKSWGARYGDGFGTAPLPARGLVLHHSVTPPANGVEAVRLLEAIGQKRFGGGISYTFAVTPDGTVYQGHSVGRRGAHTKDHNSTVRAVVLVGDYRTKAPTPAQVKAVGELLAHGVRAGWWRSAVLLGGHRQLVPGTECPGDAAVAAVPSMNAAARQLAARPVPVVTPARRAVAVVKAKLKPTVPPFPGTIRLHSRGAAVRAWQAHLRKYLGWAVVVDGEAGPATVRAIREAQRRAHTGVDGIAGKGTWAATHGRR